MPDSSRHLSTASTPEAVLAAEVAQLRRDLADLRSTVTARGAGAWRPYTATLTAGSLGSGGSASGDYAVVGDVLHFRALYTMGTAPNLNSHLFDYPPLLPANLSPYANDVSVKLLDAGNQVYLGAAVFYTVTFGVAHVVSGTQAALGNVSNTFPFTWAAGDTISLAGSYRIAR